MRRRHAIALLATLPGVVAAGPTRTSRQDFERLAAKLAAGWNTGDARAAADCFTVDAVYVEPPGKQVYRGRETLYRFFGGESGRPGAMQMNWRNLVFDETSQRGMGEFSFRFGTQVHGVAVMALHAGLISQWREYFYASELPFEEFIAPGSP